jgi:hypothetical protein
MLFRVLAEVPLPSTPTGRELSLAGGRLLVSLEGGTTAVELSGQMTATPEESFPMPTASPSEWVLSEDGGFRVRTRPEGRVDAERLGRLSRKWKAAWSLRVPGATRAPALVLGERVLFGSVDNQVYCVRRKNGHRLWAADLDDRISSPLAAWRGEVSDRPAAGRVRASPIWETVLVVPDGGASLFALDVYDGSRLATFEIASGDGMLATAPLVLPDGRVVVARTSYASGAAALLVLRPAVSDAEPKTGP